VVRPIEEQPGRWRYPTPDGPFELWRFEVTGSFTHTAESRELLLCTGGSTGPLHRGATVYLAAGETITLDGPSRVFRVAEN